MSVDTVALQDHVLKALDGKIESLRYTVLFDPYYKMFLIYYDAYASDEQTEAFIELTKGIMATDHPEYNYKLARMPF
jgi:hypothetical protein